MLLNKTLGGMHSKALPPTYIHNCYVDTAIVIFF